MSLEQDIKILSAITATTTVAINELTEAIKNTVFVPPVITREPIPTLYSLEPWKLTLPTDDDGNGRADEILQPDLLTYSSEYFPIRGGNTLGKYDFICPAGGATTSTAKYARTELRHLTNFDWNTETKATLEFSVGQIDPKAKVVVFQCHDASRPEFKVVYTGESSLGAGDGLLRVLYKGTASSGDSVLILKENMSNGEVVKLDAIRAWDVLSFNGNNGGEVFTDGFSRSENDNNGSYYWKQGNYYQALSGGDCIVTHYTGCVNPVLV